MKNKVEIYDDKIIKYNTGRFSSGYEKVTESLGINFKREVRVYSLYNNSQQKSLMIPKLIEHNKKQLILEKITAKDSLVFPFQLVDSINEFLTLPCKTSRITFFDILSSPSFSILRGYLFAVYNFGFKLSTKMILIMFKFLILNKKYKRTWLIHKDLKNKNIINSANGYYIIDFGSSILTKNYFLFDIVDLALNIEEFYFDMSLVFNLLESLGYEKSYIPIANIQVKILLFKKFLHLPKFYRSNKDYMSKVKNFILNLDKVVEGHYNN
jgi:serine/threonine protein kinase